MRIEALELYHLSMPIVEVFRTGCSEEEAIQSVIVRMISD